MNDLNKHLIKDEMNEVLKVIKEKKPAIFAGVTDQNLKKALNVLEEYSEEITTNKTDL